MKATFTLCAAAALSLLFSSCSAPNGIVDSAVDFDDNYPMGYYHKNGYVISPYKPYNIMNVKGMTSGHLARDPSTADVDPTTGKPIMKTAKIFRIPEPPARKAAAN